MSFMLQSVCEYVESSQQTFTDTEQRAKTDKGNSTKQPSQCSQREETEREKHHNRESKAQN